MKNQAESSKSTADVNVQALKGLCQAVEQVAESCRVSAETAQNAKANTSNNSRNNDNELRSVARARVDVKRPKFGNRRDEDVEDFWTDWRRYKGMANDGKGMTSKDQLESLRDALDSVARKDYVNIMDSKQVKDEKEYGVLWGNMVQRIEDDDHDQILIDYVKWSLGAYSRSEVEKQAYAMEKYDNLRFDGVSFQSCTAEWRDVMNHLSKANITKDKAELFKKYMELLPESCSSHVALHASGPSTWQEASEIARKWFAFSAMALFL